jgi:lipopolysaccharide transport system ATP-binding protein
VTALLELGTGFNNELSGRENIYLNGMLIGMSKEEIQQKEQKIIDFSELNNFIDEPLKTYSSGMIMRLAFSIAIHSSPDILIVDEALSVGDAHFSAKCNLALKELKKKNLSIIYVSHDLNSLKILCDRLILLNKGEIIEEGNPEDVINVYNYLIAALNKKQNLVVSNNSFGNKKAKIISTKIIGLKSNSNVISSGERAKIILEIKSNENIKSATVGILIRDRFGQDIFGTNTFYLNKKIEFKRDKKYLIEFETDMNIGVGKYSLTAAIHTDENHLDECIDWVDKASEFEIAGIIGSKFIGICKLNVDVKFKEI